MGTPGSAGSSPDVLDEIAIQPWHRPILDLLATGPQQYVDIKAFLMGLTEPEPPRGEGQVNRALRQMRELDLIKKDGPGKQAPWVLTTTGQQAKQDRDYFDHLWALRGNVDEGAASADTNAQPAARRAHDQSIRRQIADHLRGLNPSVAHPARRYDYWLGGKDNFAADRASGDALEKLYPGVRVGVRANRDLLRRVVRYLVEQGVRQFLDIGTGLPTAGNVHHVAQAAAPESRVVYVDNDPLVANHARALLTSTPQGKTAYIDADLRKPAKILAHPVLRETLDLTEPVALLLFGVLHFIDGEGSGQPLVDELIEALAPGSFMAVTHVTDDFSPAHVVAEHERMRREGKSDFWMRDRDEIAALFENLQLVEPGVVPTTRWRPEPDSPDPELYEVNAWAAVGRKTYRKAEKILTLLIKNPWYEHILRALADAPLRYADLRPTITVQAGSAPGEGQLNTMLRKLTDLGLIEKEGPPGRSWSCTTVGHAARLDRESYRRLSRYGAAPEPDIGTKADDASPIRADPREADVPQIGLAAIERLSADDFTARLAAIQPWVAHPARRYNFWLGGKDNFAADRESAAEFERLEPDIRKGVVENRDVLRRMVHYLAAERGVRQFLDIGAGLPTEDNVHEVAQAVAPDSRVVYVDNDLLVANHARALLTSSQQGRTAYLHADLHEPASILRSAQLLETLDLNQPVGLILVAVLHFIDGPGAAQPLVQELMDALAPGSFLAVTHATGDFLTPEVAAEVERMRREGRSDFWLRDKDEVVALFDGLEVVEPGIVPNSQWRPRPHTPDLPLRVVGAWAGLGHKR
ncbi:SAM-dependent methyltransferase [Nucisporomicrobium flavum]|uniref:SAM-dependent methyltransferase n=1 Tax=Nucisporomicrobium flavum TaxID=2785915 RepID=UPI0027DDE7BD|nr:SAM-dependent methyltransferase [Nucisporomicrobium flavum]